MIAVNRAYRAHELEICYHLLQRRIPVDAAQAILGFCHEQPVIARGVHL